MVQHGQHLLHPFGYGDAMPINSQRWFMRKEDYEEKKTPSDSPFRCFIVKCVKCDSFLLSTKGQ
jgi:hypothetical protein